MASMTDGAIEPSITLAMIVRNESDVIDRCLESVRDLLSNWVIVDTGSTDDTIERIEHALIGVPGSIHRRPWIDFGHNRSELMELARGTGTHLLLVDADMTVRIEGPLLLGDADAYDLRQEEDPTFWTPRLVRSDLPWTYRGRTHEYLSLDAPFEQQRCYALVVEHHGDGGTRHEKYERDRRLLEVAITDDPLDPRAHFYLAQTLRETGEIEAAIDHYRTRVALGGWAEETFYADLQIGTLLAGLDWDAAVAQLLRTWESRPTRAEPLYELARGWRIRGAYALTHEFSRIGLSLEPTTDTHFVHTEATDWGLRFELSIAAFHLGRVVDCRTESERLLSEGVPASIEPWVRHNLAWCARAQGLDTIADRSRLPLPAIAELPSLGSLAPSTRLFETIVDVEDGWSRFNPSIASRPGGGFLLNIRSSNYRLVDGAYVGTDGLPIDVVRTDNVLCELDADLVITSAHRLPSLPPVPDVESDVVGAEDLRLVHHRDRWKALSTARDRDATWTCRMLLFDLGVDPIDTLPPTLDPSRLAGPDPHRNEKNWMPFVVDDELLVLYLCDPTLVLRVDDDSTIEVVSNLAGPPVAAGLRGGSPGVDVGIGHLFVVHETMERSNGRLYAHRLLLLDRVDGSWTITAMSPPFHFVAPGIEFCAGLALDGDRAMLSFGVNDHSAWLAECSLPELLDLLVPLRPDAD